MNDQADRNRKRPDRESSAARPKRRRGTETRHARIATSSKAAEDMRGKRLSNRQLRDASQSEMDAELVESDDPEAQAASDINWDSVLDEVQHSDDANSVIDSDCPHCGSTCSVGVDQIGQRIRCSTCRQRFVLRKPSRLETDSPTTSTSFLDVITGAGAARNERYDGLLVVRGESAESWYGILESARWFSRAVRCELFLVLFSFAVVSGVIVGSALLWLWSITLAVGSGARMENTGIDAGGLLLFLAFLVLFGSWMLVRYSGAILEPGQALRLVAGQAVAWAVGIGCIYEPRLLVPLLIVGPLVLVAAEICWIVSMVYGTTAPKTPRLRAVAIIGVSWHVCAIGLPLLQVWHQLPTKEISVDRSLWETMWIVSIVFGQLLGCVYPMLIAARFRAQELLGHYLFLAVGSVVTVVVSYPLLSEAEAVLAGQRQVESLVVFALFVACLQLMRSCVAARLGRDLHWTMDACLQ